GVDSPLSQKHHRTQRFLFRIFRSCRSSSGIAYSSKLISQLTCYYWPSGYPRPADPPGSFELSYGNYPTGCVFPGGMHDSYRTLKVHHIRDHAQYYLLSLSNHTGLAKQYA
ncbi:unnamed protein product, partial [Ceratitis capitata]